MNLTTHEKKSVIAKYIDISHSRLKDYEVEFLYQLVSQYDRFCKIDDIQEETTNGWSSDGKYTRLSKTRYYFSQSEIGIFEDWSYHDDDGQSGKNTSSIEMSAREVINWFKNHHKLSMFNEVKDIIAIIEVP